MARSIASAKGNKRTSAEGSTTSNREEFSGGEMINKANCASKGQQTNIANATRAARGLISQSCTN
jgi:hypothetical protein